MNSSTVTSSAPNYKPWWKKYSNALILFFGSFSFAGYLIAFHLSNPIPNKDDLIKVPIKVIRVQNLDPHLLVQLEDGTQQTMEFPVVKFLKGKRYYGIDDYDKKKLKNCSGHVLGVNLKLAISDQFRVWDIDCGDVRLTYEKSTLDWNQYEDPIFGETIISYLIFILFVSGLLFWIERRKK